MKKFKINGGSLVVRKNGYGVDKLCPVTNTWSVLFLSSLSRSETDALYNLFNN